MHPERCWGLRWRRCMTCKSHCQNIPRRGKHRHCCHCLPAYPVRKMRRLCNPHIRSHLCPCCSHDRRDMPCMNHGRCCLFPCRPGIFHNLICLWSEFAMPRRQYKWQSPRQTTCPQDMVRKPCCRRSELHPPDIIRNRLRLRLRWLRFHTLCMCHCQCQNIHSFGCKYNLFFPYSKTRRRGSQGKCHYENIECLCMSGMFLYSGHNFDCCPGSLVCMIAPKSQDHSRHCTPLPEGKCLLPGYRQNWHRNRKHPRK